MSMCLCLICSFVTSWLINNVLVICYSEYECWCHDTNSQINNVASLPEAHRWTARARSSRCWRHERERGSVQQRATLSLPRPASAEEELSKFTAKSSEFSQEFEKARSLYI